MTRYFRHLQIDKDSMIQLFTANLLMNMSLSKLGYNHGAKSCILVLQTLEDNLITRLSESFSSNLDENLHF